MLIENGLNGEFLPASRPAHDEVPKKLEDKWP